VGLLIELRPAIGADAEDLEEEEARPARRWVFPDAAAPVKTWLASRQPRSRFDARANNKPRLCNDKDR
jgi:hypothetical protein